MRKVCDIDLGLDWARFWQKIHEQNPEFGVYRQAIRIVFFAGMQNVVALIASQEDRLQALWECQKQLSEWDLETKK